jgi:hypothetical protein
MTCVNWTLTVFAIATFIFAMWPEIIGATAAKWVISVIAVLILIIAWTGVICKPCSIRKKK